MKFTLTGKIAVALARNPLFWMLLTTLFVVACLSVPVVLPIGPMFWDLYLYLDGAQRIAEGQIPSVDFSVPVGPLPYYLFSWMIQIFPNANIFLLAQWSFLPVLFPLMAALVIHVFQRSPHQALMLLLPFLLHSVFSANLIQVIPNIGIEAWGIYNRHAMHLLYLLLATLVFSRSAKLTFFIIAVVMFVLFMTKITAFLAGGIILFGYFMAGRIALPVVFAIAFVFIVLLGIFELQFEFVSSYLFDISNLVQKNSGGLFRRFLSVGVTHANLLGAGIVLCGLLYFRPATAIWHEPSELVRRKFNHGLVQVFDHDWLLFAMIVFAGIAFETQNAGGQPLVFVWPFLIPLFFREYGKDPVLKFATFAAIGFLVIPTASVVLHKSARVIASMAVYERIEQRNLKNLGLLSTSDRFYSSIDSMRDIFIQHEKPHIESIPSNANSFFLIHIRPDFQLINLGEIDRAIEFVFALEKEQGKIFETVWMMDFANPVAWLMDRKSPRYVPIGIDPSRTMPALTPASRLALSKTNIAFIPTCPKTFNRKSILANYLPAFENHERIRLTPCMDAFIKP